MSLSRMIAQIFFQKCLLENIVVNVLDNGYFCRLI